MEKKRPNIISCFVGTFLLHFQISKYLRKQVELARTDLRE